MDDIANTCKIIVAIMELMIFNNIQDEPQKITTVIYIYILTTSNCGSKIGC